MRRSDEIDAIAIAGTSSTALITLSIIRYFLNGYPEGKAPVEETKEAKLPLVTAVSNVSSSVKEGSSQPQAPVEIHSIKTQREEPQTFTDSTHSRSADQTEARLPSVKAASNVSFSYHESSSNPQLQALAAQGKQSACPPGHHCLMD